MKSSVSQSVGRHIVVDPKICHGKPTFRGTRIMVADVLEQVAEGLAWESIIEEWRNSISKEAIAEASQLARQAFLSYMRQFVIEKAVERDSQTVIRSTKRPREGWEEAFHLMTKNKDDRLPDDISNQTRWDDEEWEW